MFDVEKPLPASLEAEQALLGGIMIENSFMAHAAGLKPSDFYSPLNKQVFEAMQFIDGERGAIDPISINEYFKVRGYDTNDVSRLVKIMTGVPSFTIKDSLRPFAAIVKEKSLKRDLLNKTMRITNDLIGDSTPIQDISKAIDNVATLIRDSFAKDTDSFQSVSEVIHNEVLPLLESYKNGEMSEFVLSTGFPEIDKILNGGVYLSDLMAVIAPPKSGKSAFALQLAANIAEINNVPVAVFSLEMSNVQNVMRMISQRSYKKYRNLDANPQGIFKRVKSHHLKPGIYEETLESARTIAAELITLDNLYICQIPLEFDSFANEIRRLVKEKGLKAVVVDYWQLVQKLGKGRSTAEMLAEIAKGLKKLAQELSISIITMGQFNKEGLKKREAGNRLSPNDMSGSNELLNSANIVVTLDVEDADENNRSLARKGTLVFNPMRSSAPAKLDIEFVGQFLTIEITQGQLERI